MAAKGVRSVTEGEDRAVDSEREGVGRVGGDASGNDREDIRGSSLGGGRSDVQCPYQTTVQLLRALNCDRAICDHPCRSDGDYEPLSPSLARAVSLSVAVVVAVVVDNSGIVADCQASKQRQTSEASRAMDGGHGSRRLGTEADDGGAATGVGTVAGGMAEVATESSDDRRAVEGAEAGGSDFCQQHCYYCCYCCCH